MIYPSILHDISQISKVVIFENISLKKLWPVILIHCKKNNYVVFILSYCQKSIVEMMAF